MPMIKTPNHLVNIPVATVFEWALGAGFGLAIGAIAGGVLCYALGMIARAIVTGGN